jgi:hypothetical protein
MPHCEIADGFDKQRQPDNCYAVLDKIMTTSTCFVNKHSLQRCWLGW